MTGSDELPIAEIEERVLEFVRTRCLVSPCDVVILSVSGGADSLCMLHLLHRLRERLPLDLHVAHLDHMLRGHQSRDDARFVAAEAAALGLPFHMREVDVAAHARARATGLEEAGREMRYRFLRDVAQNVDAARVATGHTRDDAVETVMLNIIRGSGVRGLRGLEALAALPPALEDDEGAVGESPGLIRPLLTLSHANAVHYCSALGLEPRVDASNASPDFLRNRVRHELLPLLRDLNAGADDALLRLAAAAREDDNLIMREADALWSQLVTGSPPCLCLDWRGFRDAAPAVRVRLIERVSSVLSGSSRDLTMAHIMAVQSLAAGPGGKTVRTARGIIWRTEGDALLAFVEGSDPSVSRAVMPIEPVDLNVPGETLVQGWRVNAVLTDTTDRPLASGLEAVFDADRVGERVLVRRRKPGDRMRPLGMSNTRKVQDVLVDCKVPAVARDGVPLVCAGDAIMWIVGCRVDDRFKVLPSTRSVLKLTFTPA